MPFHFVCRFQRCAKKQNSLSYTLLTRMSLSIVDVDDYFDFGFDFADSIGKEREEQNQPSDEVICPNAGIAKTSKYAKHKRRSIKRKNYVNSMFILNHSSKAPNMSRRVPRASLCAFPTFDKCDSLVFLPVAMARFLNSGDIHGLQTLLNSHKHKQNFVMNYKGLPLALKTFIHIQEILSQACPDQIMCVHDTKVVDNTIRASVFSKYTENKLIYEFLAPTYNAIYPMIFSTAPRTDRWKKKLQNSLIPDKDRQQLAQIAGEGVDLIVYANMDWVITFDNHTRKVTNFEYSYYLVTVKDGRDSSAGGLEVVRDAISSSP